MAGFAAIQMVWCLCARPTASFAARSRERWPSHEKHRQRGELRPLSSDSSSAHSRVSAAHVPV